MSNQRMHRDNHLWSVCPPSTPRRWHQPTPGIRPLNPSHHNWTGPQKTKQKSSEDVI